MNKYVIIRSDTKTISLPMPKNEALQKLKLYDRQGITSYIVYKNRYLDYNFKDKSNIYKG